MIRRVVFILMLASFVVVSVSVQAGNTMQEFLKAPQWYVQYDVAFKVDHKSTDKRDAATTKTWITMDRKFTGKCVLDMRIDGPAMTLNASLLGGGADGASLSTADAMKMQQDMFARMETAANWMSSGGMLEIDENASDADQQDAMAGAMNARLGPGSMDYVRIDSSWGLVDEMGTPFTLEVRTTWNGSGLVLPGGGVDPLLEIDAPTSSFALTLPHACGEMGTLVKRRETATITDINWKNPRYQRDSSEVGMDLFPGLITIDDPKNLQAGAIIIRGKIDPSTGKIAGQHSVPAHYDDKGKTVSGTFVLNYTLSLTPPAKKK